MGHSDNRQKTMFTLLQFINSNLDRKLSLAELSQVSGISKFHLLRVFEACLGLTPGQYIRLQRLESGMMQVVLTDKGVLDIALEHGYESHSTFCREFKKHFGMPPGEFRKQFIRKKGKNMAGQRLVKTEFIGIMEAPDIGILYVRKTGNYFESAPAAWEELSGKLAKYRKTLGQFERFGISHDNPHDEQVLESDCRFDACIKAEGVAGEIRQSLKASCIDGGKFAVFRHQGPLVRLGESFHYIYGSWVFEGDRKLRHVPPYCRYLGPKASDPFKQIAEIRIPVF